MRKITKTRELQEIELGILKKIHAFCEAHGLRYSLCGGTLLGAIRHKGFIPWDDDLDIFMPRPDYERFCREFHAEGVSLHTHENDAAYVYPFAKVYDDGTLLRESMYPEIDAGVYVDVFPLDGFPNGLESMRQTQRERSLLLRWNSYKRLPLFRRERAFWKTLLLWGIRVPLVFFTNSTHRFFIRIFCRRLTRHGFEKQPFIANMAWGVAEKESMPANLFSGLIDVDFEGEKFKALVGWEVYLRNLYGDFMQLPPPEKRVAPHSFSAWRK